MQDKESFTTSISELTSQLARKTGTTTPPPPAAPQAQQQQQQQQQQQPHTSKLEDTRSGFSSSGARPQHETGQHPEPTHPSLNGPPLTPRRMSVPSRLPVPHPTRNPLSPVLDPALGFSVARRPRLDFARACTSLHHSTLAESSPESSPLTTACPIPRHPGAFQRPLESPIAASYPALPSSIGSASMLDYPSSEDSSSDSGDDDLDGDLDLIDTPSQTPMEASASLSLLTHQKARLNSRSTRRKQQQQSQRHSYTPGMGGLFISPSPTLRAHDKNMMMLDSPARRESLSLGPSALDYPPPGRPEPLRRPVTRRGSLLPKTKNFQRIKAALIEESCPVDVEVKHEAEITRQIREDDPEPEAESTPSVNGSEYAETTPETENSGMVPGTGLSFQKEAQKHGGFWFGEQMEGISGSPPAFPAPTHRSSDGDIIMDSGSVVNSPVGSVPPGLRSTKRRRTQEDWFEPSGLKRRAVSPGVCGSPMLGAQSPPVGTGGTPGRGGRGGVGLMGMNDTNDGLMKMSLQ